MGTSYCLICPEALDCLKFGHVDHIWTCKIWRWTNQALQIGWCASGPKQACLLKSRSMKGMLIFVIICFCISFNFNIYWMQQGEQGIWISRACLDHRILKNLASGYAVCPLFAQFKTMLLVLCLIYCYSFAACQLGKFEAFR